MSKLSGDSKILLNLLPYLQPDAIDEAIFLQGSTLIDEVNFSFLNDEMESV
jgi:hypothetical protein